MSARSLNEYELAEVKLVFANSIEYEKVQIIEDDELALRIEKLGSCFARRKASGTNAVTFGNKIRFSRNLQTKNSDPEEHRWNDIGWLVHELTHVWQYQKFGWVYLPQAVGAHLFLGPRAYKYSVKKTIKERGQDLKDLQIAGKRITDFNREQQGDITRDFYIAQKRGEDTSGWMPFIEEIRSAI